MRVSQPISVVLPDYGVLFAESVHAPNFRMAERADPFHKLVYVLRGRVAYRETGRTSIMIANAGSVLIVPRGTPHQMRDEKSSVLLLLCLAVEFLSFDPDLPGLWLELVRQARRPLLLGRPACQAIEEMWRRAMAERHDARPGSEVVVRSLAAQILAQLARLPTQSHDGSASDHVAAVQLEMSETFYDHWSIDRAAARAGLSRRRFTCLFRAASGQTFLDFLVSRRLERASMLLRAGEHSVVGVIFSCGFNDVSHFYRLFRRRFGCSPGQWAKRHPP
jgi:AraC family L-rhamnose operon regulatory protein RhaS